MSEAYNEWAQTVAHEDWDKYTLMQMAFLAGQRQTLQDAAKVVSNPNCFHSPDSALAKWCKDCSAAILALEKELK